MSEVYSLVYQPAPSEHVEPYHYNRVPVQQVTLIAGHGIEGDQKAGHHPDRQLNIMSYEVQQELSAEGFKAAPGELGEQIALRGLDVRTLSEGDRVQLGDTAVVEIVKPRTGCDWFEQIQGRARTDAANRLGVLARVLEGGVVKVGDPVRVLEGVEKTV
jgi:MOSC domain-containing protein YiiM